MEYNKIFHHINELNLKIMLNISSNLYKSSWIDLVFENRNKSYGAYQLRAQSSSITLKALLIAAPAFILLFAGPAIYKRMNPDVLATEVTVADIPVFEPPLTVKPEKAKNEPLAPETKHEKVKTVKLTANIKVVEQPEINENPPTIDEIKDAAIGQVTQAGEATKGIVTPVEGVGNGPGTMPAPDNTVYETSTIENYPEFEGGMAAWAKFIQRNLRYPEMAVEAGVQGKVFVSFVVEKDGTISNVTVVKGVGHGCDEEAMRVIKKSPRWKPGFQHNMPVRVRYNMPLSFTLSQ